MRRDFLNLVMILTAFSIFVVKLHHTKQEISHATTYVYTIDKKIINKQSLPQIKVATLIENGAWLEIFNRTLYDTTNTYQLLQYRNGIRQNEPAYPWGDIDPKYGVCSDLTVRAMRVAGYDLQKLIHDDILNAPDAYNLLHRFGQIKPDPNIDHRRVDNQLIFLQRHAQNLCTTVDSTNICDWQSGDIVIWDTDLSDEFADHVGIISSYKTNKHGYPYVINNNGRARLVDCLTRWKIVGHFRFPQKIDLIAEGFQK